MTKRVKKNQDEPTLVPGPPLERFVELLNMTDYWKASLIGSRAKVGGDYRPIQAQLSRLVTAWHKSGPNVKKLLDAYPGLSEAVRGRTTNILPTETAAAQLAFLSAPEYLPDANPQDVAMGLFLDFLLNPQNKRLRNPCASCGSYFLTKTNRAKAIYCSGRCGRRFTSQAANRARREYERDKRLADANRRSAKWLGSKASSTSWRTWMLSDPSITKTWLTRELRAGKLTERSTGA